MEIETLYIRGTGGQLERTLLPALKTLPSGLFRSAKGKYKDKEVSQQIDGLTPEFLEAFHWENFVQVCPREGIECERISVPDNAKDITVSNDRSVYFNLGDYKYKLHHVHR
jgi:hypothetical protein